MIGIGISPGLQALGYVVLSWDGRLARCSDCDVLRARRNPDDSETRDWFKRSQRHRLLLSVIFERARDEGLDAGDSSLIVGIAPAYTSKEHPGAILQVQTVIEGLSHALGARTICHQDSEELRLQLAETLEEPPKSRLKLLVESCLKTPLPTRGREMLEASAAALLALMIAEQGG